jgi:hypothetical protein
LGGPELYLSEHCEVKGVRAARSPSIVPPTAYSASTT